MPRVQESTEGRILRWFRIAPLVAAGMLLALVKDAVRERHQHTAPRPAAPVAPAHKAKMSHKKKVVHRAAPPAAVAPKKRVRHRRPRPAASIPPENDSFTSGELED